MRGVADLQHDPSGCSLEGQNDRNLMPNRASLKRPGGPLSFKACTVWAALLSVLTVVMILTKCVRFPYMLRGKPAGGRLLAGRNSASAEDPEIDAIVQLCLEMEEEHSQPLQPPELLPHVQWTSHGTGQHFPGSQQDLQANAQGTLSSSWEGLLPYSSSHVPESHQGPGMQSGYDSLTPSADIWEAPESLLERPSTSAWGSTLLLPSVGSSLTTASLGNRAPVLPVDGRDPSSLRELEVSRFAYTTSGDVPEGEFGVGEALPQPQLWAHPGTRTQPAQAITQRDMPGGFPGTFSLRKRQREEHTIGNSPTPPKKPKTSSKPSPGTPQQHESTGVASGVVTQQRQLLESAREAMVQGLSENSWITFPDLPSDEPVSYSLKGSLAPSAPHETSSAALVAAMQQASTSVEELPGSSLGTVGLIDYSDDNSTLEHITSTGGVSPAGALREHPFYNIPALQPGAVFRPFSLDVARTHAHHLGSLSFDLQFMRSLTMRDMVYRADLDGFVSKMEALAGHLLHSHTMSVLNLFPREAVRLLGIRYLILDALFVGSKVLEEAGHTSSWWEELVTNIPSEVDFQFTRSFGSQFLTNVLLAEDLCTSIEMLKKRIRPSRETTILLKKQLFCEPNSPPYFKRSNWDPWRADDKKYGGGLG